MLYVLCIALFYKEIVSINKILRIYKQSNVLRLWNLQKCPLGVNGTTSGTVKVYPSGALEFSRVHVGRSSVFYIVFCMSVSFCLLPL